MFLISKESIKFLTNFIELDTLIQKHVYGKAKGQGICYYTLEKIA